MSGSSCSNVFFLFIHFLFVEERGPVKCPKKAEGGWCRLTSLFQLVKRFTMCQSVSDSSTARPARVKKAIDTESPAPPPLLLNLKIFGTRHSAPCAEDINTLPLVSENGKFKYISRQ